MGFDYNFIMAATGDRVPTVFIEDHRVVNLDKADPIAVDYAKKIGSWPTGKENPELLKMHPSHGHDMTIVNGISRIGFMTGGKAALWKDEDMSDVFTKKAVEFIEKSSSQPFFLYLAAHEPHVPRVPHPRFIGKTELGPRGDAIAQLDWSVGQVLATLDRLKIAEKTLVIFTSDNGPVVDDGYKDDAVKKLGDHKPAGPLRAGKYSSFEGGTRVPFIVRWPDRIKPGVSDALVCQIDLLTSLAALTGQKLAQDDAPDSFDLLPVLLGEARTGRDHLVEQGGGIGFRLGQWKYIEPASGPKVQATTNTETGRDAADQLYDLTSDLGEQNNVAAKNPDKVAAMRQRLKAIRDAGRSRP